jgi:hypothetical protein
MLTGLVIPCRIHWYMGNVTAMLSGLYLAEMSIDRLIAVRFPMSAPRLCTTSRAMKTVVITAVLVIIFNLQVPFVHVYVNDPSTGKKSSDQTPFASRIHLRASRLTWGIASLRQTTADLPQDTSLRERVVNKIYSDLADMMTSPTQGTM